MATVVEMEVAAPAETAATTAPNAVAESKPASTKDTLQVTGISIGSIGLGLAMLKWHEFYVSDLVRSLTGGEAVQAFRLKYDILWCRPTGVVLIGFGALLLFCIVRSLFSKAKAKA